MEETYQLIEGRRRSRPGRGERLPLVPVRAPQGQNEPGILIQPPR